MTTRNSNNLVLATRRAEKVRSRRATGEWNLDRDDRRRANRSARRRTRNTLRSLVG